MFAALRSLAGVRAAYTGARVPSSASSARSTTFRFDETPDHPAGPLIMIGLVALRMRGARATLAPAPKYGAHQRELLSSEDGATWCERYLP